ncbi:MAG TPA: energy transducer TonB [Steroidobacteraceae bacterium]|nr:energy transducer TonB [Steroidobacteraceae bacterium]
MNAIDNRWGPEEVRLWGGSALGALLVHFIPMALLLLYIHWTPRLPPPAGSHNELDVQLAALPSAASTSPAAASPQRAPSQPQMKQTPAQAVVVSAVRPLREMPPAAPQAAAATSNAPPAAQVGEAGAPVATSDLGAVATGMTVQLWMDEVRARLKSHMVYPSSAIQRMQQAGVMQDTVTLQFTVDQAGHVTYSHVDSVHHYQDLEQETRQMLRLSSNLPAPPPSVALEDKVVNVPVQFFLDFPPCSGPNCSTAQNKLHAMPPPSPTLASCTAAVSPGPSPAGSAATLDQMRAYQDNLNRYLAAAGKQLTCLSQVQDLRAPVLRDKLARQLHSMVDGFNTQARVFEATQAQALQAQQARQRQAQALVAKIYAACTAPRVLEPPGSLSAQNGASYRRQLLGYQAAVSGYVACLQHADQAAADPARGLASDQRAQLHQSATQLGNAAIASFNAVVGRFNAQVPQIRKAIADQANLAEAVVRGTPIFPTSSWNLPVPLPSDECVYITQIGQGYQAHLCNPSYSTTVSSLSQELKNNVNKQYLDANGLYQKHVVDNAADNALPAADTQVEAIAAQHGFPNDGTTCSQICAPPVLGIALTTQAGFGAKADSAGSSSQTISYSVSELRVAGRRVSMTISQMSSQDTGNDKYKPGAVHLDLALSADNQTLHGYCWTDQQRSACTLTRHTGGSVSKNSTH